MVNATDSLSLSAGQRKFKARLDVMRNINGRTFI